MKAEVFIFLVVQILDLSLFEVLTTSRRNTCGFYLVCMTALAFHLILKWSNNVDSIVMFQAHSTITSITQPFNNAVQYKLDDPTIQLNFALVSEHAQSVLLSVVGQLKELRLCFYYSPSTEYQFSRSRRSPVSWATQICVESQTGCSAFQTENSRRSSLRSVCTSSLEWLAFFWCHLCTDFIDLQKTLEDTSFPTVIYLTVYVFCNLSLKLWLTAG